MELDWKLLSVSRLELSRPDLLRHLNTLELWLVGISARSRSAQYPPGNHTHSKPSLAGRGGSIPYEDPTGPSNGELSGVERSSLALDRAERI